MPDSMRIWGEPTAPALRFEDTANVFDATTVGQTPEFQVLLKVHKFGLLNANWRLTLTDLQRFTGSRPDSNTTLLGLALDALPVVATSRSYADWKRSATLLKLSRASAGLATVLDEFYRTCPRAGL